MREQTGTLEEAVVAAAAAATNAAVTPALGKDSKSLKCSPLPGSFFTSRDHGDFKRHQP